MNPPTPISNPPTARDLQTASVEHLLLPDQNPNPVLVVDNRFGFVYQNRTARRLSEEMDLDGCRELLPPEWMQHWPPKNKIQGEYLLPGQRLFSWTAVKISDALWGCYGTEITDLARCEAAVQQLQRFEVVGETAGTIAHDFNNHLQVVVMSLEMLKDMDVDTKVAKQLATMSRQIDSAMKLVSQLRDFSRHREASPEETDLAAWIEHLRATLQLILNNHCGQIEEPVPVATALIDPRQLEQVVINLLLNARDAVAGVDAPSVSLRCQLIPNQDEAVWWQLRVRDNGTGMDEAVQQRIFDPFFTTKGDQGTGLGLSSAYGILHRMGGKIEVESTPGEGTEFRILIPVITL